MPYSEGLDASHDYERAAWPAADDVQVGRWGCRTQLKPVLKRDGFSS